MCLPKDVKIPKEARARLKQLTYIDSKLSWGDTVVLSRLHDTAQFSQEIRKLEKVEHDASQSTTSPFSIPYRKPLASPNLSNLSRIWFPSFYSYSTQKTLTYKFPHDQFNDLFLLYVLPYNPKNTPRITQIQPTQLKQKLMCHTLTILILIPVFTNPVPHVNRYMYTDSSNKQRKTNKNNAT